MFHLTNSKDKLLRLLVNQCWLLELKYQGVNNPYSLINVLSGDLGKVIYIDREFKLYRVL